MEYVLQVNALSKTYGSIKAVDDLSFNLKHASVFGVLGPNGSGKTTTLGMLCGIINSNSGSFKWFGVGMNTDVRKRIGTLLETPNFYDYLTAYQNLKIVADIKNSSYSEIDNLLKMVNLYERKNTKFKTFSLGMKQRLAIAATLIGNPEVLILDEPTNGLDPQGIAEVRTLIKRIAKDGKTILIASHLLDEVQKICSDVLVLKNGKKVYQGAVDKVFASKFVVELQAKDLVNLQKIIGNFNHYSSSNIDDNVLYVEFSQNIDTSDLNKFVYDNGLVLSHLKIKKQSLEEQILHLLD